MSVPSHVADDAAGLLVDAGADGAYIDESTDPVRLQVAYSGESDPQDLADQVRSVLGQLGLTVSAGAVEIARRDDEGWAESWKQYFQPLLLCDRVWVVPSWHLDFVAPEGAIALTLDPGMAFGTGQHATTQLCATALVQRLDTLDEASRRRWRVLDLGCGSGILSITAAKLGVAGVLAVDIDPVAVEATTHNSRGNGVTVGPAERLDAVEGSVEQVVGTFDLVVANILAVTLVDLCALILDRVAPGGRAILSGILDDQADDVVAAFDAAAERSGRAPLRWQERRSQGEWVALEASVG